MPTPKNATDAIHIHGARQNNLKNLDLTLPLNELIVVTGVSGSGKSSLVFDTLYAEGQRRYVETFSPYARQFLDRMDRPQVDRIDGIPPAIAIDQTNPVRSSRSTVGTMTEINDHLKLLYARAATLYCRGCSKAVKRDTPASIFAEINAAAALLGDPRVLITFSVPLPKSFAKGEVRSLLEKQGYTRIRETRADSLIVVQDRLKLASADSSRVMESLESALRVGNGRIAVHALADDDSEAKPHDAAVWRFSTDLHCAQCNMAYRDPVPSAFSFNSPLGACDTCRGFGRVIGIDYGLVVPDQTTTLREGAVKPWQTKTGKQSQNDMVKHAKKNSLSLDIPYRDLPPKLKDWVVNGDPGKKRGRWYGIKGYFEWLESKSYKMHVRVLLSKYRSYSTCPACNGARLKPESLLWRLGADTTCNIHEMMLLPIERVARFMAELRLPTLLGEATDLLMGELRSRLRYLDEVGLAYLTLDRQSRTLSGGEVQRINLTTALGTSLVHTLFVLDEPSIGLHPRDMQRVIEVMKRLRDAGNSLVVVEHDPQIMAEADRILDIGPGAGEHGGEIVAYGTPAELKRHPNSLTGAYLSGRKVVAMPQSLPAGKVQRLICLRGVTEHNLRNIDIEIPLNRLVCVTGVSGSGKSTLIEDVLYPAMQRARGKPTVTPGAHRELTGWQYVVDAMLVDQSPIGRTTRSNPASHVGALDCIRTIFAAEPESRSRKYTAGTFSFNSGTGRCPACGGNGFEHIEMQFLSDVYLRCPECNGRRYRDEVLEVRHEGADGRRASIADVLEMTVTEALIFFAKHPQVKARLAPLADVGLEYVRLGQPVPTLSGGEAQRLKLAGHLADAAAGKSAGGKLLMFDEPTTGLHFADVAKLMGAFRKLLSNGHSLLVIEHNLDVIRASDWLIDLGPEGGDGGGEIVATGTPEEVMRVQHSHTGRALIQYAKGITAEARAVADGLVLPEITPPRVRHDARAMLIHNAREHNLKNIDVRIPHGGLTVITGVSGSGKSTLAFDIIFNEGQRRYLESLNAYARQFVQPATRPDVDAIYGIPPTVAIEQRTSRGGRKSTVATLTEIYHFLRLMYVKLGTQYCPDCDVAIEPQSADAIAARILKQFRGKNVTLLAPLVVGRKGIYTDLARWASHKGYFHLRVDGANAPTDAWPKLSRFNEHNIELPVDEIDITPRNEKRLREALDRALDYGKGVVQLLSGKQDKLTVFSSRRACPSCGTSFTELDPRLFSFNSKQGWCEGCFGTGLQIDDFDAEQSGEEGVWRDTGDGEPTACEGCHGARLNPVALAVRFRKHSITAMTALSVNELTKFFAKLRLVGREAAIARDLAAELKTRLAFLARVGLGYLTLDRSAPTLSGGETQRIRLAAQLGSNLKGVCYVLDEPTIGLHPRDNKILLSALSELASLRNTLVVVEHDEDTIRQADHVVDLGPGAGTRGGRIVGEGRVQDLIDNPGSTTGRFLKSPLMHPKKPRRPVKKDTPRLEIEGATLHNLRDLDISVPLGRLVVVTGVSGSGKSTLARDVLYKNIKQRVGLPFSKRGNIPAATGCKALRGVEQIDRILEVDQTPIGKTPRSCPATYVGFWDNIRRIYASTTEASIRAYDPSRFSFNTSGGRCEACEGQGVKTIEMSFLPDVKLLCDVCGGRRFDGETLSVLWRGKSVGDLLAMSVEDAVEFFKSHPAVHHSLTLLNDVGLGYLTLGQPSPTLSGGEAQRIKLVTELARIRGDLQIASLPEEMKRGARARHSLYVLDEPTVGLHMADVEKLITVLHRLVDGGNSVIVVEHNLDVIAEADWILDLGPEAGDGGGKIVVAGTPADVAARKGSRTGEVLIDFLEERT
ncbi:MAG: excinuclease ABC subunit UvrA [Steroidobacteraceae bacterium]